MVKSKDRRTDLQEPIQTIGSQRPSNHGKKKKTAGNCSDVAERTKPEIRRPNITELRGLRASYFGTASSPQAGKKRVATKVTEIQTAKAIDHQQSLPLSHSPAIAPHPSESGTSRRESKQHERPKNRYHVTVSKRAKVKSRAIAKKRQYASYGPTSRETEEFVYDAKRPVRAVGKRTTSNNEMHHPRIQLRRTRPTSDRSQNTQTDYEVPEILPEDSISIAGRRLRALNRSPSLLDPSTVSEQPETASVRLPSVTDNTLASPNALLPSKSKSKVKRTSLLKILFGIRDTPIPGTPRINLVQCLACLSDNIPEERSIKLECNHRMCYQCVKRIFTLSVTDPAHMPPRCCTNQHIPLNAVEKLFDVKFKLLWNRKYEEYQTKNRLYCPNSKCGQWIRPTYARRTVNGVKYAQCTKCGARACLQCKSRLHRERACPKDPGLASLMRQAKEQGWQQCYKCRAMVELKEGCNHMTCRCTAEFCMLCGCKWKTCDCPWLNIPLTPQPDQEQGGRRPEAYRIVVRRVRPATPERSPVARGQAGPAATYQAEMGWRLRQEQSDAELAHRLQVAALLDLQDEENIPFDHYSEWHALRGYF